MMTDSFLFIGRDLQEASGRGPHTVFFRSWLCTDYTFRGFKYQKFKAPPVLSLWRTAILLIHCCTGIRLAAIFGARLVEPSTFAEAHYS